jgi:biopolymer transport protein ExbD
MGLQADLPHTATSDPEAVPEANIVQVSADGSLRINQSVIEREALAGRLH